MRYIKGNEPRIYAPKAKAISCHIVFLLAVESERKSTGSGVKTHGGRKIGYIEFDAFEFRLHLFPQCFRFPGCISIHYINMNRLVLHPLLHNLHKATHSARLGPGSFQHANAIMSKSEYRINFQHGASPGGYLGNTTGLGQIIQGVQNSYHMYSRYHKLSPSRYCRQVPAQGSSPGSLQSYEPLRSPCGTRVHYIYGKFRSLLQHYLLCLGCRTEHHAYVRTYSYADDSIYRVGKLFVDFQEDAGGWRGRDRK